MSTAHVSTKPRHLLLAALGSAVAGALLIFVAGRPSVGSTVRAEATRDNGEAKKTARAPAAFTVVTCLPGLPAETVVETITRPIERGLSELPDVAFSESKSIAGVSMVKFTLHPNADPGLALAQVNARLLASLPALPPGCPAPLVQFGDPAGAPALGLVVLDSPALSEHSLWDVANLVLRPRLARVPGVRAPLILGGKERQIVIYLDRTKMTARGLSITDVERALKRRPGAAPLGVVRIGRMQYFLEPAEATDSLRALRDLLLPVGGGDTVALGDVGVPRDDAAPQTSLVRFNGRRTVCVPLFRSGPEVTPSSVTKAVARLEKGLPEAAQLRFLPLGEEGAARDLTVFLRARPGQRLAVTEELVAKVEAFLKRVVPGEDLEWILAEVGVKADPSALFTQNAGTQDATLRIRLARPSTLTAPKFAARLRGLFQKEQAFADLQVRFRAGPVTFSALDRSALGDLAVEITGARHAEREQVAGRVAERVRRLPGTSDVALWQRADAPGLLIDVAQAKALALGLTPAAVERQVALAFNGVPAGHLRVPGKAGVRIAVSVRYPDDEVRAIDDLLNTPLTGASQKAPVLLKEVARVLHAMTHVEVSHRDGFPVLDVLVNADGGAATKDAVERAIDLKVPRGVTLKVRRLTRGGGH